MTFIQYIYIEENELINEKQAYYVQQKLTSTR